MSFIVAADIGATKTRVGIFDSKNMKLLIKTVFRTPQEGDENVVAGAIIDAAEYLVKTLGLHEVMAIGVGSIGPLDIRRGCVVNSPNIPLKNFSIRTPLMRHFNKPTYVVNDCVAAVYAEFMAGAGVGKRNVIYITISSGIGGGVVIDGHVLLGKDGNAHEIGHLVVSYDSDIKCGCGGIGHWEALASGSNVWKLVKQLRVKWHGNSELYRLSASEVITAETLFRHWRDGDGFASYVVSELTRINAAGIASVINAYDPEVISFGGSVVLNNPEFLKQSLSMVNQYVTNRMPEYAITSFGDDVVIYGAAWVA
ncbi:MAG: ROK family protein, partial [Zestosphaera sp.]